MGYSAKDLDCIFDDFGRLGGEISSEGCDESGGIRGFGGAARFEGSEFVN